MSLASARHGRDNSGKRRLETSTVNARQYVDLEAEVRHEAEDDESSSDNSLDEFIDYEPPIAGRDMFHTHLFLEHEHASTDDRWQSLLERVQMRVARERTLANLGPNAESKHGLSQLFPTSADASLYKVPVKPGFEEIYAFRIMRKILAEGMGVASEIRSVVGRSSYPGWIFVESTNIRAIYEMFDGFHYAFVDHTAAIPFEIAIQCLRERMTYTPQSPGWVRLSKRPYQGDTAYVFEVNPQSLMMTLIVVPRIQETSAGKRKRGSRPPRRLFNARAIAKLFGDSAVTKSNQTYHFKNQSFLDGFLRLEVQDIAQGDVLPTREELDYFELNPSIPRSFIQAARREMDGLAIRLGDRVLITSGAFQGLSGAVLNVTLPAVEVKLPALNTAVTITCDVLRKDMQIGDQVRVFHGPNANFTGWVMSNLHGVLTLFNHKTETEIKEKVNNVEFWSADFVLSRIRELSIGDEVEVTSGEFLGFVGRVYLVGKEGEISVQDVDGRKLITVPSECVQTCASKIDASSPSLHTAAGSLGSDPNRHFIGHQVILQSKGYKHYRGVIRGTLDNGYVLVELEASLRRVRVALTQLALSIGGRLVRLTDENVRLQHPICGGLHPSTLPQITWPDPPTPSTPRPSPSTEPVSPAWDPSSRTPVPPSTSFSIPLSSQPLTRAAPLPPSMCEPIIRPPSSTPWFSVPELAGKRLKVQIIGTMPVLRDPGFQYGKLEGKSGITTKYDDMGAKVVLGFNTVDVPPKYVKPILPTVSQELVVVTSGPLVGNEYSVVKSGPSECTLKKRNNKGRKKVDETLPTETLCVICKK